MKLNVWCFGLIVCWQCQVAHSQSQNQNEISNLLIDQTYSLSGQIFYRRFAQHWYLHGQPTELNVVITEKNVTGSACILSVLVNQNKVYEVKVTPNSMYKNPIWKIAVSHLSNHLKDIDVNKIVSRHIKNKQTI